MSDDLLQRVKAAAAREAPPEQLAERVLEHVAYRARLEAPLLAERSARFRRLFAGCVSVALAAGAWLWARSEPPTARIAAEQPKHAASGQAAPAVVASVAEPPPDPCRGHVAAAGKAPLIDDFEDGDDALSPLEQRAGFWRWARESDAPGTAPALLPVPRVDSVVSNKLALHVKGGQLFDWGATVEVNFRPPCYDATSYAGIKFQARGPGRVYAALREEGVIPPFEGGTCQGDCYNSHVAKLELGPAWRTYELRWAELRQRGLDRPALDPSRLHSIAFLIRAEDTPYDIWLDDVRFLQNGGS